jgi:hypothetical protein
MKVGLINVAKWEDYYLKEWLDYNEKLGFDKVLMFQNDWRTDLEHPILDKRICDGPTVQVPLYNQVLQDNTEYDWLAFIDCDEFIVLKKHNNIKELIEEYQHRTNVIGLNWTFFGNLGKETREGDSLLKQFKMRNKGTDQHIKVIVNARTGERMMLPHNTHGAAMDTNGHKFMGPFNPEGPMDVAYISHIHNKTKEDWELRCKRGRVDALVPHDYDQWEREIDSNNEVEDLSAYNFLYEDRVYNSDIQ